MKSKTSETSESSGGAWATPRNWRLAVAGLGFLAVALHLEVINHAFTFDDHIAIEGNPTLEKPLDIVAHLTSGFWGPEFIKYDAAWRPFTTLTLSWNQAISGLAPGGYLFVNALLHALATMLLALLGRAYGLRPRWAIAAAALFAVHPLHVEAIAPGVGRADVLMAALGIGALLAWERGRTALALILLALAMLSKEMAAMLVFVLMWRELTSPSGLAWKLPAGRRWLLPLALFVAWLLARYLLLGALGGARPGYLENPLAYEGVPERIFTAGVVYLRAVELFVVPLRLVADYSYATIPPAGFGIASVLGLVLLVATCAATLWAGIKRPVLGVMLALWIGPYLLVSHLGPTLPMIFAERVLYLPTAGLCLAVAFGLERVVWQRAVGVAFLCVCALFAWRSHDRLEIWESDTALWGQTLKDAPRGVKALCNGARAANQGGDLERAIELGTQALEIGERTAAPHLCLAEIYISASDAEKAAALIAKAGTLDPEPIGYRIIECAFAARFVPDDAIALCERAIASSKSGHSGWMYLGIAYDHAKRPAEAERAFLEALKRAPRDPMVHFNYGSFLANNGRLAEALDRVAKAHDIAPDHPAINRRLKRLRSDLQRRR